MCVGCEFVQQQVAQNPSAFAVILGNIGFVFMLTLSYLTMLSRRFANFFFKQTKSALGGVWVGSNKLFRLIKSGSPTGFLIILTIIGCGYFIWIHYNPGWVKYSNTVANFEIELPGNWKRISDYDGSSSPLTSNENYWVMIGEGDEMIELDILLDNSNFQSIDEFASFVSDIRMPSDFLLIDRRPLSLEKGMGEKLTFLVPLHYPESIAGTEVYQYIFMEGSNKLVAIKFNESNKKANRVTSSFRFVE